MEEVIANFRTITQNPYESLTRRKDEKGINIVGCLPMYVPEEIIHAAGMLPIVLQKSAEPITIGHSHVPTFFCGIVRSLADMMLKYKFDFLDMVVSPDICLPIRGLSNVALMNMHCPVVNIWCIPYLQTMISRILLIQELEKFKRHIEEFAGQKIEDVSLKRSIAVYNENHALLRQLYKMRRNSPALLSSIDIQSIVAASMLMPKEEHSQLLKDLLSRLRVEEAPNDGKIRLVLSGSLCEAVSDDILNIIEEAGGIIVADDLYIGSRYFLSDVADSNLPMEAIANRYLNMNIPCPTRIDQGKDWSDYLLTVVRNSQAQGLIHLIVKYCEPHDFYYPYLERGSSVAGIPSLLVETEHEFISVGQIRTKVEAFIEMIRGRRNERE